MTRSRCVGECCLHAIDSPRTCAARRLTRPQSRARPFSPPGGRGFLLPMRLSATQMSRDDNQERGWIGRDQPIVTGLGKALMSEQLTGAQALVRALENAGVDTVFGIPGGAILPAYDPLLDSTKIRHILVRHEQGAGHAAEGYAAASGKVGVCMATSGPGRDQPGHADRRRVHGLGADGRDHRSGGPRRDRHGRLPGGRHLRHHDADHEAQLPGQRPDDIPRDDRRGVPHRLDRPARPGARRRRPRTRCRRGSTSSWPTELSTCPATGR